MAVDQGGRKDAVAGMLQSDKTWADDVRDVLDDHIDPANDSHVADVANSEFDGDKDEAKTFLMKLRAGFEQALRNAGLLSTAEHTSHAEEDDRDQTPLIGAALANELAKRWANASENADWYRALFATAFDRTHDARQAMQMADHAFAHHPDGEHLAGQVTPEEMAGVLDDHEPPDAPEKVGNDDKLTGPDDEGEEEFDDEPEGGEPVFLPPAEFNQAMLDGYTPYHDPETGSWIVGDESIDPRDLATLQRAPWWPWLEELRHRGCGLPDRSPWRHGRPSPGQAGSAEGEVQADAGPAGDPAHAPGARQGGT